MGKYLTLIDTITLLHQHQRPLQHDPEAGPHIRATLGDIAAANRLAPEILCCCLDELPPQWTDQATSNLRRRDPSRRGGNAPDEFPSGTPDSLARHAAAYLESLAVRNHTPDTIEGRRDSLKVFLLWSIERDLTLPGTITKPILESYQRHLWHWRKKNGNPLGVSTQRARLLPLKLKT